MTSPMPLLCCLSRLIRHPQAVVAALALTAGLWSNLALSHPLPLWRVSRGQHSLYLLGSIHLLKAKDYPLPKPMMTAFHRADILVEEINLLKLKNHPAMVHAELVRLGLLPAGVTLPHMMGKDWPKAQRLARNAGISLTPYRHAKPWYVAIAVTNQVLLRAHYDPRYGIDHYFARLAKRHHKPLIGLETLQKQLSIFNRLPLHLQREFLLQSLQELSNDVHDMTRLYTAWKKGRTAELQSLLNKDFHSFPKLRRVLLEQRNKEWLPKLKSCLRISKICLVVVGAFHMIGTHGLIHLFRQAGYRVQQLPARKSASTHMPRTRNASDLSLMVPKP